MRARSAASSDPVRRVRILVGPAASAASVRWPRNPSIARR